MTGLPIPIEPHPTGRTVQSDLERAHTPAWRIPTVDPGPPPAAEHRCKACREYVHDVSDRGWCTWCEEQAALAIAPITTRPQEATVPQPADPDDEQPVELPDYILEFAILMRDTEAHDDPTVRAARKVVANAAVKLQQAHRTWAGRQRATTKPKPKPRPQRPPAKRGPKVDPAVTRSCVNLYLDQRLSIPQIAERLHLAKATVRRHLLSADVQLRDDRTTRSGGTPTTYSGELIADLVRRYVEQQQTTTEIAKALRISGNTVTRLLREQGVTVRPPIARQPNDHAAALRQRMTAAGITTAKVRAWCKATGIDVPNVGLLPARIVDAYLDAHQPNNTQEKSA
jgi:DNA invertase Pin-like site-specific DNA recombinase